MKIVVELLSTLALATKQVKQGRLSEFVLAGMTSTQWNTEKLVKKLRGEKDIEATLQRLDRLTLDEGRATAAEILGVVHGLVAHRRANMGGEGNVPVPFVLLNFHTHIQPLSQVL